MAAGLSRSPARRNGSFAGFCEDQEVAAVVESGKPAGRAERPNCLVEFNRDTERYCQQALVVSPGTYAYCSRRHVDRTSEACALPQSSCIERREGRAACRARRR